MAKSWYRVVKDRELKDGATTKRICLTFETDSYDLAWDIETYFKRLMDADQSEPKTRCPKCGRTDCIKDMKKDFGIKDSTYKYKCINCNTYIKDEPKIELVNDSQELVKDLVEDEPNLFDLMNRFEELCSDIRKQLRQSSAEIASAIRETQGKE